MDLRRVDSDMPAAHFTFSDPDPGCQHHILSAPHQPDVHRFTDTPLPELSFVGRFVVWRRMMRSAHLTGFGKISTLRLFQVVALVVIVFSLAAVTALGGEVQSKPVEQTASQSGEAQAAEEYTVDVKEQDETVTMAIDLEAGGTIDLDVARGDLVIDTWDGSEVLVIVERMSTTGPRKPGNINFKVSRLGNNVRIAALDDEGRRVSDVDFSYRIMVPRDRQVKKADSVYDLSKLSSVVFKALHREALNWLMR